MFYQSIFPARVCGRMAQSVTALMVGTFLVGCTGPGAGSAGLYRTEPTYLRVTGEQEFAQALRRHYLELATNAFDRGDTQRSDFYSLRALMAAEGKLAEPGNLPLGGEISAAGTRLNQLLQTGARTGSADLAARAQAAFDCWMIESGESGDPQIAQSCRYNALNALAQLEGASTGAQLVASGGPREPQGQTYVIEAGSPSQTIHAPAGFTIEVVTEHHAPVPVAHHVVQPHVVQSHAIQSHVVQPHVVQSHVATAPVAARHTTTIPVEQVVMVAPQSFVQTAPIALAPPPVSVALPTIDLGPIETLPAVQESFALAPIETVPVFNTTPIETLPQVEIASLPTGAAPGAATALIDAALNSNADFSVFFGFDSDEVTIEAEDVLIDTIEQIKLSGAKRITLMGYTDSAGDARYNQLLAMRRAQSVRKFLQKQLGTSVSFEILPVGEMQAVRNGGDGVKDALNRKVGISLR